MNWRWKRRGSAAWPGSGRLAATRLSCIDQPLSYRTPMFKLSSSTLPAVALLALLVVVLGASAVEAAQVSKCLINGTVSYQQGPCPTDAVRRHPTVEELNAAEKKKRAAAAAAAATSASSSAAAGRVASAPSVAPSPAVAMAPALAPPAVSSGYRCDGRTYCSQMTSCDEAKYFLANCPAVNMDGDNNGIPCERQWCKRWPSSAR